MTIALNAIQQVSNATFASGTTSLSEYVIALNGVSDSQAAVILKSQGLTANFAKQILMERGATEADAELALTRVGLIATTKELSATQVQQALTNTALSAKQKEQIIQALGLTIAQEGEIASTELLTAEQIKQALATQGIVGADAEVIAMKMGLTVAEGTATVGVSALTKAIITQTGAIITWLATNPVGWLILLAGAIAGAVALFDVFTVSLEEQQKKTEKLKEEYDKVTSKLSELNGELDTTNSRMDELNNKDNLSFIEEAELQKLKDSTFELERQIALQKELADAKQREVADSVKTEYEKDFNDASEDNYYASTSEYADLNVMSANSSVYGIETKLTESEYLNEQKNLFQETSKEYDEINKKKAEGIALTEAETARLTELKSTKDSSSKFLLEDVSKLQDYIDNYGIDDEFSQGLKAQIEEIDRILNPDVYKTADFERIIGLENLQEDIEKVKTALKDGNLSVDTFSDSFPNLTEAFRRNNISVKDAVSQFLALNIAVGKLGDSSTDVVTFDETLTAVSENLDILSAVQKDLTDDGRLSIDTMQKLSQAGLDYNTIVGTNGESLRDLIITQLDAEIATKRLALAQAQLNAQSAAMAGQDWSGFAETATQLANELAESENTKKIVIGTQYTPTEKEKKTKEEVPEQIQNFKNLESKYQHYVSIKKMSEEDFMAWYGNAYKNAYKGYENSEEYADDYRSAMEKVFTWEEDRHKDLFDKRIQSINNEIDLVIKTKTDFSGNELETKEYFRQLKDLYTQQIDETNLRINEVLEQGVIGNGEYLEELEKQKIEYTQKIEDLNKEAFESEKEYIESIKDAELKAIDEGIDKVKEEQKAKEEANQKEIDGIQAKIDAINEENDTKEKSNDLTQAELDLQQKLLNLEKAKSSYKRKIIGAGGNVEYAVDNEAVANAEKELKEARAKVADLKKQGEIDALEAQKKQAEKKKDSDNEGFETQINGLETEKETREKFYEDVVARLDKIINPDKQTESNSDTWEEVAKTDTTVSTDNGVTTVDGKEIPSSQNATSTNPQPTLRENDLLNNKNQPEQKQTFSPTTVNDYFKSMGINIPNVSDMVNMFPDITKSLFDNMLGNTSSSIANTSSIVNNDGGVVNTITVGDIVISNPVGNINDLSKELKTQLPSAIKKILAQ